MKKLILAIAVLIAGYAVASPYITVYRMKAAAERGDGEALSEHIDFPLLRQNFKDQFNVLMAKEVAEDADENPFSALGALFGGMMVDGLIDAYVTPAAITEMMKGRSLDDAGSSTTSESADHDDAFEDVSLQYRSWGKFIVSVPTDDGESAEFVLRRRGLGWKLTNIKIPMDD